MNKPTLPGATEYAREIGAEFINAPEYPPHATDDQGFPLRPSCCAGCAARSKAMNADELAKVYRPWTGRDLDREEAIENDEDLEVTPTQSGGGR